MGNIIKNDEKFRCTGCRVCEKVCPQEAISFFLDTEGFNIPKVDEEKCINCDLCVKRCPQINDNITLYNKLDKAEVYAAILKDKEILNESTSGGIFSALSISILNKGGIVVGCNMNEQLQVNHIVVDSVKDLKKLRGSKYVQSDVLNTYITAKKELDKGRYVLYTGTPCQINGLRSYLNKEYDKLFTVDLVCHGVPSPKLFQEYIKFIEKKNNERVNRFDFRYKGTIGYGLNCRISLDSKKIIKAYSCDSYYKSFIESLTYREACYSCKYSNTNRVGDITLGDFWGLENFRSDIKTKDGVSLVILNTNKGQELFRSIDKYINKYNSTMDEAVYAQKNLKEPSFRSSIRDNIYVDLEKLGYEKAMKKNIKVNGSIYNYIFLNIGYERRQKIKLALKRVKGIN